MPAKQALATSCPCHNVTVNWLIAFGTDRTKEVVEDRQPFRVNSFDSKHYRIERDGIDITGKGTPVKAPWEDEEEEDEE
jgi:hypothetical protein